MSSDDIARIAEKMNDALGPNSGLGGTLKIDFGAPGAVFIDGRSQPNTVTLMDAPADCTVTIDLDNFKRMIAGELDPVSAYMQGKLKVEGDMSLAARLGPVLRDARAARAGGT